jgi:hypothetical protein
MNSLLDDGSKRGWDNTLLSGDRWTLSEGLPPCGGRSARDPG